MCSLQPVHACRAHADAPRFPAYPVLNNMTLPMCAPAAASPHRWTLLTPLPPRLRELTTSYPSFVLNSVASVGDLAALDSRKNSADVMSSSGNSLVAPVR